MGLKAVLFTGLLVGGGVMAVRHVPGLRANVYEFVNPRVKEARLLDTLADRVNTLDATFAEGEAGQESRQALAEVEELVAEITALNEEHAGLAEGIVAKLVDEVVPMPQGPQSPPSSNNTSSGVPSSPVLEAAVSPTAPPPPCTP